MHNALLIATLAALISAIFPMHTYAQHDDDSNVMESAADNVTHFRLDGELGIYYERKGFDRETFIEDGAVKELVDSYLLVPYFQYNYLSPHYARFQIGAGLTAHARIDTGLYRQEADNDYDKLAIHKLYAAYTWPRTTLKIGRQNFEDAVFLRDYYEALSIRSQASPNVFILLASVKKVADSDISKFIKFQDVKRGDELIDDYLYAFQTTWNIIPRLARGTLYYYRQKDYYDLYGAHVDFFRKTGDMGFGLHADFYVTDEHDIHGLKNADGEVRNSTIYHFNPFMKVHAVTGAAGYIRTGSDVGAREGGLIDDYFNPFNEGDKIYEPDARTWYGTLEYASKGFRLGLACGRTDYLEGTNQFLEKEYNIRFGYTFLDHFTLEAQYAVVTNDAPRGDFTVLESALAYEF